MTGFEAPVRRQADAPGSSYLVGELTIKAAGGDSEADRLQLVPTLWMLGCRPPP